MPRNNIFQNKLRQLLNIGGEFFGPRTNWSKLLSKFHVTYCIHSWWQVMITKKTVTAFCMSSFRSISSRYLNLQTVWHHSARERKDPLVIHIRVFAENLFGLGFLQSVSYIKSIPTHEKLFAVGKRGPNATFNLIFLGVGSVSYTHLTLPTIYSV